VDDGVTLNGYQVREGTTGVPIFEDAVGWIECSVNQTIDVGTHDLFLGEVVDVGISEGAESVVARM
jgi:flavin reductase (DIM6/NTAB) family NADH-FMN oxidoreductase RutF